MGISRTILRSELMSYVLAEVMKTVFKVFMLKRAFHSTEIIIKRGINVRNPFSSQKI